MRGIGRIERSKARKNGAVVVEQGRRGPGNGHSGVTGLDRLGIRDAKEDSECVYIVSWEFCFLEE